MYSFSQVSGLLPIVFISVGLVVVLIILAFRPVNISRYFGGNKTKQPRRPQRHLFTSFRSTTEDDDYEDDNL